MGRSGWNSQPGSIEAGSPPPPFVKKILPTHFRRAFFALLVVALVEGSHNLLVVADRITTLPDRFLFYLLHVFAAGAFVPILAPFQALVALVWCYARRKQRVQNILLFSSVVGSGLVIYSTFAVRIERALNFVLRRIFSSIEYDLSPSPRSLWQIAGALLIPALLCCWSVGFVRRFTGQRIARGEFPAPRWLGVCCLLVAAAAVWWNATFWVNLYRPLHVLLIGVCIALLQLGLVLSRIRHAALLAVLLSVLISVPSLHFILVERRSIEVLALGNTTSLREQIRVFRSLSDFDGDGSSRWFGGDDPDDGDPERWYGRMEIPGNGVDDNGLGDDVARIQLQDRKPYVPALNEPVNQVVLISVDALRWDALHFLNSKAPSTPALDALAARSLRFRRAYSQASYTRYSFGSMWHSCIPDLLDQIDGVDQSLPAVLQNRGVPTVAVVPSLFERLGFKRLGFDRFYVAADDAVLHKTSEQITDRALEVLSPGSPGFYWIHYFDPHSPYVGEASHSDHQRYGQEVESTDLAIGRLLRGLAASSGGRRAILFMSDHGDEFGEHGGAHHGQTLYEEVVHVPLLVQVDGVEPAERERPVMLIDLAPTVLDLFHISPPRGYRGHSLLPSGQGPRDGDHRVVSMSESGVRMFIDSSGRWKIIWKLRDDCLEVFDLVDDPQELRNLVDDAPERVKWLIRQLELWMAEEAALRDRR